ERKEISSNLKDSEKRYRDLFHLSPQPMWVCELETLAFLDVNQSAVNHYGYSKDEFLSMSFWEIRHSEEEEELKERIKKVRKSQHTFSKGIFNHKKKNGEMIQVDVQGNIIEFKGKKAELVLANDITERMNYIRDVEDR